MKRCPPRSLLALLPHRRTGDASDRRFRIRHESERVGLDQRRRRHFIDRARRRQSGRVARQRRAVFFRSSEPDLDPARRHRRCATALASGTLVSASVDSSGSIPPTSTTAIRSTTCRARSRCELIDLHTIPAAADVIEAHTTMGRSRRPEALLAVDASSSFTIPSGATDVPPGWVLNAPPELNYTWADLMHNIDGIRFFVINPGRHHVRCVLASWRRQRHRHVRQLVHALERQIALTAPSTARGSR